MPPLAAAACLIVAGLVTATGCTRAFYRTQADREVYCLEDCASGEVDSDEKGYSIQPSPESRMFDPDCPDLPPQPPDDPVSHQLMRCVDGKRGWPYWKCYGNTPYVENPQWEAYLPRDDQGRLVLDRQAAVELALVNSRDYQQQLENLYLSALDVSFQRFRFDIQFFGGNSTFFEADKSGDSTLTTDTNLEMRKLFATGGELVVGVANSFVWQFAGPDEYSRTNLLDFSLVQPLLRAGGRAVVLESLTDSERALLANIRQMERFRRGFYTEIIAGGNPGPGPSPGGIGLGSVSPGGGGGVGGFLSLLSQQVLIRNQEANVVSLRDSLAQLEAIFEAGGLDSYYQVDQAQLTLYQAQIRLLNLKTAYQDSLDAYKVLLGLPPSLELAISDPLLNRFDLIDPALTGAQNMVTTLLEDLRNPEPGSVLVKDVAELESVARECAVQIEAVQKDFAALDEALPTRREHMRRLAERPEFKEGDVDPRIVDVKELDKRVAELEAGYADLSAKIGTTLAEVEPYHGLTVEKLRQICERDAVKEDDVREKLKDVVSLLSGQMIELSLTQARARLETVTLQPLTLSPERALEIARENRRDWKNARAALVDVWRQVEVAANALESDLSVSFSGDLSTISDSPVRFKGTDGSLRVGVEFDAPLTRLAERNDYRRALINYQQARRSYYAYEDEVNQALRESLRQIRVSQVNFEQRRAAVTVAASQVWLKQYDLLHKPQPAGASFGATTARDVVDALNNLLSEQNNFLGVWVEYEVQRMNLAFDLGTMELDSNGMWIDRNEFDSDSSGDGDADDLGRVPAVDAPELRQVPAVDAIEAPHLRQTPVMGPAPLRQVPGVDSLEEIPVPMPPPPR